MEGIGERGDSSEMSGGVLIERLFGFESAELKA
jgi:hypothetical protein